MFYRIAVVTGFVVAGLLNASAWAERHEGGPGHEEFEQDRDSRRRRGSDTREDEGGSQFDIQLGTEQPHKGETKRSDTIKKIDDPSKDAARNWGG